MYKWIIIIFNVRLEDIQGYENILCIIFSLTTVFWCRGVDSLSLDSNLENENWDNKILYKYREGGA